MACRYQFERTIAFFVKFDGVCDVFFWLCEYLAGFFGHFDYDALRLLRKMIPSARISVLVDRRGPGLAMDCAAEVGAENLHPPMPMVSQQLVARVHAAGLALWTWTVNQPVAIEQVLASGVDGVFSDWPDRVVAARG